MTRGTVQLGRILGIPIGVNYSWFIALWIVAWSLATSYFPLSAPGNDEATYWVMGIAAALLLFASVVIHELGHALTARRYGIQTRSITLFLFGGVAQIVRDPPTPTSEFLVAAAGPLTSYLLSAVFWLMQLILPHSVPGVIIAYLAGINAVLATFNLIPGFPLDGGRILRAILWRRLGSLERATRIAARAGQIVAFAFMGLGVVSLVTRSVTSGLWLILIGWFLDMGAQGSYQQAVLQEALEGMRVADIMSRDLHSIDPNITVDQAVTEHFLRYKHGGFPVVWGDRFLGLVTLHDVHSIPEERRAATTVRTIMTPADQLQTVRPTTSAYEAFTRLVENGVGRLPVVDDGQLVGMITRSDLLHLVRARTELPQRRKAAPSV